MLIDNLRLNRELKRQSTVDVLTGVYTRSFFLQRVEAEVERAVRYDPALSLVFIDVDNFKEVNDLYGESIGDEVLVLTSQIISASLPENATLYRWLDDNFIVILPTSTTVMPFDFAGKIQQSITGNIMPSTLSLTCSIGFSIRSQGQNPEDLLHNVEDALIRAKSSGKNMIKAA